MLRVLRVLPDHVNYSTKLCGRELDNRTNLSEFIIVQKGREKVDGSREILQRVPFAKFVLDKFRLTPTSHTSSYHPL